MAVYAIYLTNDFLVSDAPELIHTILVSEMDAACQKNAFLVLSHTAPELAASYFVSINDRLAALDPLMQLAIIDFIRADSAIHEENVPSNTQGVVTLLQSSSNVVKFEAATALVQLSSSPAAVKAVASCYIDLIVKETDNNAKLLVLDNFRNLQAAHSTIVNETILDVLRVLGASDLTVRLKALDLLMAGVTSRQAHDLVSFLVQECERSSDYESVTQYRQRLLSVMEQCSARFPAVAPAALTCLVDILRKDSPGYRVLASDAVRYSKRILERVPALRSTSVSQLADVLLSVDSPASSSCASGLLWIIGEFCSSAESIKDTFARIQESLGTLPIVESEQRAQATVEQAEPVPGKSHAVGNTRKLNADGTYATESALTTSAVPHRTVGNRLLRSFILDGEYSVSVALGGCVTKLALHADDGSPAAGNALKAQAMLIITSILRVGLSQLVPTQIDKDSYDRLMLFLRVLSTPSTFLRAAFMNECSSALEAHWQKAANPLGSQTAADLIGASVDQSVNFRLTSFEGASKPKVKVVPGEWKRDVERAVGSSSHGTKLASSLSRVVQLTGFSDEIYAETYVTISHSDIILDILLVNQIESTLQNVTIDLSTGGDLKVNEKPASLTLAPLGFAVAKAGIKVRATAGGHIFGSISYGVTDTNSIVLSTLHIDICEFVRPTPASDDLFRTSWPTLEWENKINVPVIAAHSLGAVMKKIISEAHLYCITPAFGVSETGEYLAANMYAQSLFSEEILANICLESTGEGVSGHLRLRSKTQGIAIALGDKITEIVTLLAKDAGTPTIY